MGIELKPMQKLKPLQFDTAGWIASSSLLLCAASGMMLAIPYDFTRAHSSIAEMLLFNPPGSLVRNFHYWSAQLFFVFTLLHVYDHLSKSTQNNIRKRRTWGLLCLALAFLGYEMISGYILKGDAAGMQARNILSSLLESIPFIGKLLGAALTGSAENSQVVYIQHVGIGTIVLMVAVYDHVKTIWPKRTTWLIVFVILLVMSLFFRAPLGMLDSTQVKGPWFFVGIQEMLHLTSHPPLVILLLAAFGITLYFMPLWTDKINRLVKLILFIAALLYLGITFMALLFRGENWEWQSMGENKLSGEQLLIYDPVMFNSGDTVKVILNQKAESCLLCHGSMNGMAESHNSAVIGCFACLKGDPYATSKTLAHRNMILVPGNFSNVRQTCGTQGCHQDISGRIQQSLMTTQSGIIGVDHFVFGETATLNDTFHIKDLGHSASDTHLRNLCAGCHLGKEKMSTGNAGWLERGGGCNACHLHYNELAIASMKGMQSKTNGTNLEIHPTIDIQVSNERCMSCHSRSGRISLNYEGWNEKGEGSDPTPSVRSKTLPDQRVLEFVKADVHHLSGMSCIDCHSSYDLMGDGKHHAHKEEAVSVQCVDCHAVGKINALEISSLPDKESQQIAWLRKTDPKTRVVLTANNSQAMMNTRVDSLNRIFLTDKLTGKVHESKPPALVCTKGKGHNRLSCEACHMAWVPQCIGCHNTYENKTAGFDMLTGKNISGTWVEYAGKNMAEPPVLGVNSSTNQVVAAMPGMVMSINQESFSKGKGKSFHRLYAPASGHTTQREGRSCQSCHNDPLAMGFGRGELIYALNAREGSWSFEPRIALNPKDQLPEDAWVGFLKEANAPYATRTSLRPFTVEEQKRILEVGSCLTCHDGKSMVMDQALDDYEKTLAKRSVKCLLPHFPL